MSTCVVFLISRGYLKVAHALACQTFQEVLLEEFQGLQGLSIRITVNKLVFLIISSEFSICLLFSVSLNTEVIYPLQG